MRQFLFSRRMRLKAAAVATSAVGLALIGATVHEYAPVGKSDRPVSIADCRLADGLEADRCRSVDLPKTSVEAIRVMPGLTVVEQIVR